MKVIEKSKQLVVIEKGKIKRGLLKLVLAVPFWVVVVALGLIAFGTGYGSGGNSACRFSGCGFPFAS